MGALTDCLGEGTHALPEVGYWAGQPPGCWYGPGCPGWACCCPCCTGWVNTEGCAGWACCCAGCWADCW